MVFQHEEVCALMQALNASMAIIFKHEIKLRELPVQRQPTLIEEGLYMAEALKTSIKNLCAHIQILYVKSSLYIPVKSCKSLRTP